MNIAIIEDDKAIRLELKILLENALYHTFTIEEFKNVAAQTLEAQPDLILLDLNLPGESGFTICSQIRAQSEVPIIFVTSSDKSMDELNAIMIGGDDYITKPYNTPILLARISSVLKRYQKNTSKEETRFTYKGILFDTRSYKVEYESGQVELTKNECRILYELFLHKGQVVKRLDLINDLWEHDIFIDDNTLSVHITRIRTKLESIGITHLIETKRGVGYKI